MTAEPDLLPCPFCGSPAEIDKGGFGEVFAACSKCWCHMGGAWSTTESDAIAAWNRRATAEKDAEIDALRTRLEDTVRDSTNKIEALRAEVERFNSWNARVSVCRDHVADIVDGLCVICSLDAAESRADKLAEALREYGLPLTGDDKRDSWEFGYEAFAREKRRRAALEQEEDREQ